jgi:hypothetical protein
MRFGCAVHGLPVRYSADQGRPDPPLRKWPFGRFSGVELDELPTWYMRFALGNLKLSPSLRATLGGELTRRGQPVPEPPPPREPPRCPKCGPVEVCCDWIEQRGGRRQIRMSCPDCGKSLGFAPQQPPYTLAADRRRHPAAALDVLTMCQDHGIALRSDGQVASFASWADEQRATPELRDKLRACRAMLGRMLGKQPGGSP